MICNIFDTLLNPSSSWRASDRAARTRVACRPPSRATAATGRHDLFKLLVCDSPHMICLHALLTSPAATCGARSVLTGSAARHTLLCPAQTAAGTCPSTSCFASSGLMLAHTTAAGNRVGGGWRPHGGKLPAAVQPARRRHRAEEGALGQGGRPGAAAGLSLPS